LILHPCIRIAAGNGIALPWSETIAAANPAGIGLPETESVRFLRAKVFIFRSRWGEARSAFESYLEAYPGGKFRDEAAYWLAQSLDKLSRLETDSERMLRLKEMASDKLDLLIKQFPRSPWLEDARALKLEISTMLAALGKSGPKDDVRRIAESGDSNDTSLKLLGLNALLDLEPSAAFPLLEQILAGEKEPSLRKKAIFLLARHFSEESLAAVTNAARTDPSEDVRKEAAFWAAQMSFFRVPTALNYYVFEAQIDDLVRAARFSEKEVAVLRLPRSPLRDEKAMEKTAKAAFRGELKRFRHVAGVFGAVSTGERRPSCKAHEIVISVFIDPKKKTAQSIGGRVRFVDQARQLEFWASYETGSAGETVLAARRGNKVSLLILQFEPAARARGAGAS
jgi:hypothetical protein